MGDAGWVAVYAPTSVAKPTKAVIVITSAVSAPINFLKIILKYLSLLQEPGRGPPWYFEPVTVAARSLWCPLLMQVFGNGAGTRIARQPPAAEACINKRLRAGSGLPPLRRAVTYHLI